MTAFIRATGSPLEMVMDGENHVAGIIQIEIRICGSHSICLGKNSISIVPFTRNPGNGLETRAAETSRLDTIGSQPA